MMMCDAALSTQVVDFYQKLFICPNFSKLEHNLLLPLSRIFNASSVSCIQYSKTPEQFVVDRGSTYAISPEAFDAYAKSYYLEDPVVALAQTLLSQPAAGQRYTTLYDDVTRRFHLTANFGSFLNSIGIGDVLTVLVPLRFMGHEVLNIGIHRSPGAEHFTAGDVTLLEQLRPAIFTFFSNIFAVDALNCSSVALDMVAGDNDPIGLIVIDDQRFVHYANDTGVAHLKQILRPDFLDDVAHSAGAGTQRNIGAVEDGRRRYTFGDLAVNVRRISTCNGSVRYVVTTARHTARARLMERCLSFGLSQRETEIVELIAAGLPDKSMSYQLSIRPRTVQNHIRSIYGKVGVHSRAQLLARLAATC